MRTRKTTAPYETCPQTLTPGDHVPRGSKLCRPAGACFSRKPPPPLQWYGRCCGQMGRKPTSVLSQSLNSAPFQRAHASTHAPTLTTAVSTPCLLLLPPPPPHNTTRATPHSPTLASLVWRSAHPLLATPWQAHTRSKFNQLLPLASSGPPAAALT